MQTVTGKKYADKRIIKYEQKQRKPDQNVFELDTHKTNNNKNHKQKINA